MGSETDDGWADALAIAVHDQRGYLSNIIVSLSLIKRRDSYEHDPKLAEIIERVENGANGLVEMAAQLQLLSETSADADFTASGPATVGSVLQNARRIVERAKGEFPVVRGGDDETVVDAPAEAGGAMVAAIVEAAGELGETSSTARIVTNSDETAFIVDVPQPKAVVPHGEALFDGSWNAIGKPQRRSVPLGLFVARRAARKCAGDLTVEQAGSGLRFTLTIPLSDREPPRDVGWG